MKWSWFGRASMALLSALALGLGMTACGGSTIAYMWTVGTQYNQIHGFKIDHYTGNLTAVQNSPFSANGTNPVYLLVKPGGRYVYVVNQGTLCSATVVSGCTGIAKLANGTYGPNDAGDSGIAVFSVGGDGALTYQATYSSQGHKHLWAQFDSTGNYLFVLDQYSPNYAASSNGSLTAFTVNSDTGRLSLLPQTASVPGGTLAPNSVEVGQSPLRVAATSACLFTLNSADQTITPYAEANGQLTPVTTGKIQANTINATSINGNTSYMVVTDAGIPAANGTFDPNQAFVSPFTVTTGCGLTPFSGGHIATGVADPVNTLISNNNAFLFVLNGANSSTNSTANYSSVSGFNIETSPTQVLASIFSAQPSGSGPDCMVEDPTQEFMYTSNRNDGTITGYSFDNNHGTLSNLSRGSTFQTNDTGSVCLALSAAVD